jgi:hypothetical protein
LKKKQLSWKLRNMKYWQHSSQKSENLHSGSASLYNRHDSPLTTWYPRWIRKGITSCVGPPCRTWEGYSLQNKSLEGGPQPTNIQVCSLQQTKVRPSAASSNNVNLWGAGLTVGAVFFAIIMVTAATAVAATLAPWAIISIIDIVILHRLRRCFWLTAALASSSFGIFWKNMKQVDRNQGRYICRTQGLQQSLD